MWPRACRDITEDRGPPDIHGVWWHTPAARTLSLHAMRNVFTHLRCALRYAARFTTSADSTGSRGGPSNKPSHAANNCHCASLREIGRTVSMTRPFTLRSFIEHVSAIFVTTADRADAEASFSSEAVHVDTQRAGRAAETIAASIGAAGTHQHAQSSRLYPLTVRSP